MMLRLESPYEYDLGAAGVLLPPALPVTLLIAFDNAETADGAAPLPVFVGLGKEGNAPPVADADGSGATAGAVTGAVGKVSAGNASLSVGNNAGLATGFAERSAATGEPTGWANTGQAIKAMATKEKMH
jgi:hypothetical protein